MSEQQTKLEASSRKHHAIKGLLAIGATAAIGIGAINAFSTDSGSEKSNKTDANALEGQLEISLNAGGTYPGDIVKDGFDFVVNTDSVDNAGVVVIHNPLKLDEKTVGYIKVDQQTGRADVVAVDDSLGQYVQMVERSNSEVVGTYDLMLAEGPAGGTVAVLNDKVGTFVGQAEPYTG